MSFFIYFVVGYKVTHLASQELCVRELCVFLGVFCEPGPGGAGGAAGSPVDDQTGGYRAEGRPKNDLQRSTCQSAVQAVRTAVPSFRIRSYGKSKK